MPHLIHTPKYSDFTEALAGTLDVVTPHQCQHWATSAQYESLPQTPAALQFIDRLAPALARYLDAVRWFELNCGIGFAHEPARSLWLCNTAVSTADAVPALILECKTSPKHAVSAVVEKVMYSDSHVAYSHSVDLTTRLKSGLPHIPAILIDELLRAFELDAIANNGGWQFGMSEGHYSFYYRKGFVDCDLEWQLKLSKQHYVCYFKAE